MKVTLDPAQRKIAALALGLLGAATGLGWWGLSCLGDAQAEAQALADRLGKPGIAGILQAADDGAASSRDLKEIQKAREDLEKIQGEQLKGWERATAEADGGGQDWSKDPGKWKDELIARQNQLFKKAFSEPEQQKVILGDDFYLGLGAYRQKSPSAEELPRLVRELSIATRLVEILMASRSVRENYPTLCRLKKIEGPSERLEKNPEGSSPKNPEPSWKFQIELEASPEVLLEYVRALSQDSWPLLVRNVEIQNELMKFPTRTEIRNQLKTSGESKDAGEASRVAKTLLIVLAGKEKLNVKMAIEFMAWPIAPSKPKGPAG